MRYLKRKIHFQSFKVYQLLEIETPENGIWKRVLQEMTEDGIEHVSPGIMPPIELAGMALHCLKQNNVYLTARANSDPLFNSQTDLASELNLMSLPILLMDEIPVGVLQITGNFSSLVLQDLKDNFINEVLYDTVKFASQYLSSIIASHMYEADVPRMAERIQSCCERNL